MKDKREKRERFKLLPIGTAPPLNVLRRMSIFLSMSRGKEKTRIQLDLEASEAQALDDLRDRCLLRSRADAVRTALAVVHWIQHETARGGRVFAVNEQEIRSLIVPGLTAPNVGEERG